MAIFDDTTVSAWSITGMINQLAVADWEYRIQTRPIGGGTTVQKTVDPGNATNAAASITITANAEVTVDIGYEVYRIDVYHSTTLMYQETITPSEFLYGGEYIIDGFSISFANDVDV